MLNSTIWDTSDAVQTKSAVVKSKTRWLESWALGVLEGQLKRAVPGYDLLARRRVGLNPSQPYLRKSVAFQIGASTDSTAPHSISLLLLFLPVNEGYVTAAL
jgi:hypothetical protein